MPTVSITPTQPVTAMASATAGTNPDAGTGAAEANAQCAPQAANFGALLDERFARLVSGAGSQDGRESVDAPTLDLSALLPVIAAQFAAATAANTCTGTAADNVAASAAVSAATQAASASSEPHRVGSPTLFTLSCDSGQQDNADSAAELPGSQPNAAARPAILAANPVPSDESAIAVRDREIQTPSASLEFAATDPSVDSRAGTVHRAAEAPAALRIDTPVAAPRWGEELAQKVIWLTGRNENRAELVLNPPHMGKVEVTLTLASNGETSAIFVSHNAQVRDAIEQSLSRLREVFAEAGITLDQASVNAESAPRDQHGRDGPSARGEPAAPAVIGTPSDVPVWRRQRSGLVDTFA